MPGETKHYFCSKCEHTFKGTEFYTSNNLEKYPNDGKLNLCKKCLTMHVNNWDPATYLWILQDIDVPYVPKEWDALMIKHAKDKSKLTGTTILGRYLAKMKLKQYSDFRWKDSELLQELENKRTKETMRAQGYEAADIAAVLARSQIVIPEGELVAPPPPPEIQVETFQEEEEEDALDLTEEDKLSLRLKWGKGYRADEWVWLEQLYNEMQESYDIQSAGHEDTLKLVCKTSLKANQLLDLGDIEGAQKAVKMYDGLMKSGRFTAAQNKAESGEYVNSISELVLLCEKEGFIPRYYTDGPQDKVDKVILDTQKYVHDLVTEEMGLGNLIENAFRQLEQEYAAIAAAAEKAEEEGDEDAALFDYENSIVELDDEDYDELAELEELNSAADDEYLQSLLNEEEEEDE